MTKGISTAPFWLDPDDVNSFPDVALALTDPDGLLAVGGDLSTERLLAAYSKGIFPWYSEGQPILWWSPNPRAILYLDELKISKSLKKSLKKSDYRVTFDTAFEQVIKACAVSRRDGFGTWIVDDMERAYIALHHAGFAHSVEVWHSNELIGGLYGVSLGKAFFGESMFSRQSDASKIALVYLVMHLRKWDFGFIDCQVYSEHLGTLGARQIERQAFMDLLSEHCKQNNITAHRGIWSCEVNQGDLFLNE